MTPYYDVIVVVYKLKRYCGYRIGTNVLIPR